MRPRLAYLSAVLEPRAFLAAGRLTVADILMADILRTVEAQGGLDGLPVLADYVAPLTARPAFRKAHADQMAHLGRGGRPRGGGVAGRALARRALQRVLAPGGAAGLVRGDAVFGLGDRAERADRRTGAGAPVWREPAPKPAYDVVIIGGGGHGLATAYYLGEEPRDHATSRCWSAGWLGGGNVGRNTTIVRANYLLKGNSEFYSHSLKLWEGLEQELNYNVMMSQRGVLNLCHSDGQFDAFARRGNAMRMQGDDAELLTARRCGRAGRS